MGKIDELIEGYCPLAVGYEALENILAYDHRPNKLLVLQINIQSTIAALTAGQGPTLGYKKVNPVQDSLEWDF